MGINAHAGATRSIGYPYCGGCLRGCSLEHAPVGRANHRMFTLALPGRPGSKKIQIIKANLNDQYKFK